MTLQTRPSRHKADNGWKGHSGQDISGKAPVALWPTGRIRRGESEVGDVQGLMMDRQLLIKRLKKKKLALKDRIQAVEDQLLPDIIA